MSFILISLVYFLVIRMMKILMIMNKIRIIIEIQRINYIIKSKNYLIFNKVSVLMYIFSLESDDDGEILLT
jgi:hypothetical protein